MSGIHTDTPTRQNAARNAPPPDTQSPADRYQELFVAVQREAVFADSKTFVDCRPLQAPEDILAAYRRACGQPGFDLAAFVQQHFMREPPAAQGYVSPPGQHMAEHIDGLWDVLTRHPGRHPPRGSALALPHAYVVPGGRFVEMYYWDSYFTMLGLSASGRQDLLHAMTDNFAYLIDTFGHVPNGTRTYYLSRSQPPVFALMAELCEHCHGQGAAHYLPQLLREHAFWMEGADTLAPGQAHRRVLCLPDGAVLNRYWDERDTPREEAWREDVATAALSDRPAQAVYRDLRAAAESGWDFSSRWLAHMPHETNRLRVLASIRTTAIVPVDLNALLYKLEMSIAQHCRAAGDAQQAQEFEQRAARRQEAISTWLWHEHAGAFLDFDWQARTPRERLNAATLVPLFTGCASPAQAAAVADKVHRRLLAPGGLATTEIDSGEQWDRPNGWAPLQWMAVKGLEAYGQQALADEIRTRWLRTVGEVYGRDGKLVEKYALRQVPLQASSGGGGGEYPLQDGFGWTSGVTRNWLHEGGGAADTEVKAGAGSGA